MKRNNIINESLKEMCNFKKLISEAYGEPQEDPRMMQNPQMAMQGGEPQEMMGEEGEEMPMGGQDPQMDDIISQIRELAIKGIARYADNIEDPRYDSLKRIWLLTDKFYEDMNGDEKKK